VLQKKKEKQMLYRVENLLNNNGLWYNVKDGSSSSLIHDLNLTGRALPMDLDLAIGKDQWRSAAESVDQLKFWFTHEDLQKLIPLGFDLYEIDSDIVRQHVTEWYTHPLFQEQGVKSRKKIDINVLLQKR
jgi:hypothetical protein